MVKSYRGVDVDMNKIIETQGDIMSLGNTKLNGRGDVVKHGKVVETRAERLKKWLESHKNEQATVNLAEDKESKKIEEEIAKKSFEENKRVAKPRNFRNNEQRNSLKTDVKVEPKIELNTEPKVEEKVEE